MDRSYRQNISKATEVLNDTKDQLDMRDMYRTLHPKTAEYTFSRSAHGTFSRIENILSHMTNLNKLKKIEIPSIFSDNNVMKPEINYRKKKKRK